MLTREREGSWSTSVGSAWRSFRVEPFENIGLPPILLNTDQAGIRPLENGPAVTVAITMTLPPTPDREQPDTDGPDRPVSRWAIATFLLGLVSLVPLSLISGIVALIKTRDGKESGRGLAVAGMVICVLWAVIWAYIEWPKGGLISGTMPSARIGTCFQETINSPVSCDKPHSDELFAMLALSRFPDSDREQRQIEKRCKAELLKYSAAASRDPQIHVDAWSPGTEWKQLDSHAAGCIAHSTSDRVGSIKG